LVTTAAAIALVITVLLITSTTTTTAIALVIAVLLTTSTTTATAIALVIAVLLTTSTTAATVLLVEHRLHLLAGISLDPLTVVGILRPWLHLTVDESAGKASHQLLGFIVGCWLACRIISTLNMLVR
jgi:hypothetical protein